MVFSTASKIRVVTVAPRIGGGWGGGPLPGDFRVIVCLTPPQMNDFCDLLGTLDAPVSKIVSVKSLDYVDYECTLYVWMYCWAKPKSTHLFRLYMCVSYLIELVFSVKLLECKDVYKIIFHVYLIELVFFRKSFTWHTKSLR